MKNLDFTFCRIRLYAFTAITLILFKSIADAQPNIALSEVSITGLTQPMQLVHAGDGSGRIFIAERGGKVKVYSKTYAYLGEYLDLSALVSIEGEGGLLSIAFHPDFINNRCFFVHYADKSAHLITKRYIASSTALNQMDDIAPVEILRIDHPQQNHYGGEMHFGQDGNLYLSVGDGGGANDPDNNSQNPTVLLGKMLRFTVATSGTATYTVPADNPFPENQNLPRNIVYAIGLRNPFRWSFDRETGDMWIGDVGQGTEEEIDFCPAGQIKGTNFGWRCYEGGVRNPTYDTPTYDTECAGYSGLTPKYSYGRTGGRSVIGGVVYRGTKFPAMDGYYIGSDHYTGDLHVIGPGSPAGRVSSVIPAVKIYISDFGESEDGEIYAVALVENKIYQIVDADALPVKLVDFSGRRSPEGVTLSWQTSNEENFKKFDIEYSLSATSFEYVGTVDGQNASLGSDYKFVHQMTTASKPAYYRLKMVDNDDSFKYSRIINIPQDEENAGGFVRPSLITTGNMNVDLEDAYQSMELVNASGKTLLKTDIAGRQGRIDVSVSSYEPGLYIVRLLGNDLVKQQKVVIIP